LLTDHIFSPPGGGLLMSSDLFAMTHDLHGG
jgi:hypothetical protein